MTRIGLPLIYPLSGKPVTGSCDVEVDGDPSLITIVGNADRTSSPHRHCYPRHRQRAGKRLVAGYYQLVDDAISPDLILDVAPELLDPALSLLRRQLGPGTGGSSDDEVMPPIEALAERPRLRINRSAIDLEQMRGVGGQRRGDYGRESESVEHTASSP